MALTSVTYADGMKVNYDYDEFDRLQQVIYFYTYDTAGNYTLTDSSGATITVTYDLTRGKLQSVTDALNNTAICKSVKYSCGTGILPVHGQPRRLSHRYTSLSHKRL